MKKNVWLNRFYGLLISIGVFTLIVSNDWKIRLVVVVLTTALLIYMFSYQLKKSQVHTDELLSTYRNQLQRQNIKLAEYMRHEWLNHFQVIMGYIQLHKFDKIFDFLQQIKEQSHRDSALSRLEAPSLIHYFLHYRTQDSLMKLDWDIDKYLNVPNLIMNQNLFSTCIIQCIDLWINDVKPLSDISTLHVKFETNSQNLHITFQYTGTFDENTVQTPNLKKVIHTINPFVDLKRHIEDSILIVELKIPYRNE